MIAWRNYRRKAGVLIRGNYAIMEMFACKDLFVSTIILENQKDRAITIFGIYLRIGFNYYIETNGNFFYQCDEV